jgi:hypothetical protein
LCLDNLDLFARELPAGLRDVVPKNIGTATAI